ncbi:MAG: hypothetical protein J6D16_00060 [Clostridia bacterium]|nr:hypothetical protein [Clostridia bacterium]
MPEIQAFVQFGKNFVKNLAEIIEVTSLQTAKKVILYMGMIFFILSYFILGGIEHGNSKKKNVHGR